MRKNDPLGETINNLITDPNTEYVIELVASHTSNYNYKQQYTHNNTSAIGCFKGSYAWLSNFYPAEVSYKGILYPTVENAYQAAKCKIESERKDFVNITPFEAKKLGKKVELRPDWEQVKIIIMAMLVVKKFYYHRELGQWLMMTNDVELIEGNDWGDTFWGINNATGEGYNILGKLLMNARKVLSRCYPEMMENTNTQ